MANVLDYLRWRGDLPIENGIINEIDAVILARLSYLPFDGFVSDSLSGGITVREAADQILYGENAVRTFYWKGDRELLELCGESERFGTLTLSGYVNYIEDEQQMQFSATIISFDSERRFLAFRGTDNSIVGWQEDFNMYTVFPLPSQTAALSYYENAAKILGGSFILGGHSKGGNLAIYAASFCSDEAREHIGSVYNLDGPGFDLKAMMSSSYDRICDKIHTFVPQTSFFGMMLEHEEKFTIIKSNQKGFFQHDIYSWEVERTSLVKLSETNIESEMFDRTLSDFVKTLSKEEKEDFIEVVFNILKETDNHTFSEMADNWFKNSAVIIKSLAKLKPEARSVLISTFGTFLKCAGNSINDIKPFRKRAESGKAKAKIKLAGLSS